MTHAVVVGLGVTGRAVATALAKRNIAVVATEDRPRPEVRKFANSLGIDLVEAPSPTDLAQALDGAMFVAPSPGVPDTHPIFAAAQTAGVQVVSEFDLAQDWDTRPVVAITGTNGKTTVTELVTSMLQSSGLSAVAAGNTDTPLVEAIEDTSVDVFVAEASSFRLGHSARFRPVVGAWLNFGPDHLDVHASLEAYETSKANIWVHQNPDDISVANADDEVVMGHLPAATEHRLVGSNGAYRVVGSMLMANEVELVDVAELWSPLPHNTFNALAAAAIASGVGATFEGIRAALRAFPGIAHRVELVADFDGIRWYNDSKATTPHAVVAALGGFCSAVLIAGGSDKGISLAPMAELHEHVRAVVAIGDSADNVREVFGEFVPVVDAGSMAEAVEAARNLASPGDVVLLSPGCASFDWYENYTKRGDDFRSIVQALPGGNK